MNITLTSGQDHPGIVGTFRSSAIHRATEDRLLRSGYFALRDVACLVLDDVVYLDGRLPSYFLKQLAQEIAAGVEGVRRVINRIDVLRPRATATGYGLSGAPSRGAAPARHTEDERNSQPCWS